MHSVFITLMEQWDHWKSTPPSGDRMLTPALVAMYTPSTKTATPENVTEIVKKAFTNFHIVNLNRVGPKKLKNVEQNTRV